MKTASQGVASEVQPVTPQYESILVPLDGTGSAAQVLPQALELARKHGATLVLLTVTPENDGAAQRAGDHSSPLRERLVHRSQAEAYLSALKRHLQRSGVKVETRVEDGPLVPTILRVARSMQSTMILGTKRPANSATHSTGEEMDSVSSEIARTWDGPFVLVEVKPEVG